MKREAMAIIGDDIINVTTVLSQITKLHQIVCGFILNENGEATHIDNNRYQALLDVLEETGDQKVVIWANYRHDIKKILKTVREKYGFNALNLSLETQKIKSDKIVGPSAKIRVAS